MKVCYSGYIDANTGMGEACRNIITALYEVGVPVTVEKVANIISKNPLGYAHQVASKLCGLKMDYNFKIIHTTPDLTFRHLIPLKYHIFHIFWETNGVPDWWVWILNHAVEEIWTGDHYHEKVFKDAGITKPIWICPQPIDTKNDKAKPLRFRNAKKHFIFYSIFQWIERKNPKGLLQAYWKEFEGEDNVVLLLKVFKDEFTLQETETIIKEILQWKRGLNLSRYPKVWLVTNSLSKDEVMRVHATGDCYVSAHRGEGYGIPIAEAMLYGHPVISTNLGGIHEHIPPDCALMVNYKMTNVFNMEWASWYEKKQQWAEVDEIDLRAKMRFIFNNPDQAKVMGEKARNFVLRELSYLSIGQRMKNRLEEVEKEFKL